MNDQDKLEDFLDLLNRPAFAVRCGRIVCANREALARLLPPGTEISTILVTGHEEYKTLGEGSLCLTLRVAGTHKEAAVRRMGDGVDLFLLDQETELTNLQMLSLAAQKLREPLNEIMTATEQLLPELNLEESPLLSKLAASINRGSYQLLRMLGNMSDAGEYLHGAVPNRERTSLTAFFGEIFQKAGELIEQAGYSFRAVLPEEDLTVGLDRQKMERATYNLLSNALRFSPKGSEIRAEVHVRRDLVLLQVQDVGEGLLEAVQKTRFERYRREPAVEDRRFGIGLGLPMTRQVAAMHGGSLMVHLGKDGGTEAILSIDRKLPPAGSLYSPMMDVDYTGARDHSLVELSGELPLEMFQAWSLC